MKKVLFLVVLALVLVAMPAFASVQNVKVSGDIDSTFVYRNQFDLGSVSNPVPQYGGRQQQNFFMTQTTLRVDADLTDKVSTTVQLLNERAWGKEGQVSGDTNVDLNLAYATIKEMLYSPLTVIVGRQNFAFGNSFVIDSAGTNNSAAAGGLKNVAGDLSKRTSLDAIRAILDYNPLTIDIVYAKINANNLLSTSGVPAAAGTKDDVDLYGVNANYKLGDKYNSVVEAYMWDKVDNSKDVLGVVGGTKGTSILMPGIHASTNPIDGLMLSGEVAYQGGTYARQTSSHVYDNPQVSAWAYQGIASYKLPFEQTKKYSPVATATYTHVSGDKNPGTSKVYTAWDPMLENQSGGKIYNAIFNLTNDNIVGLKGSVKPIEDVTLSAEWSGLWLDKYSHTGFGSALTLVQPDGSTTLAETLSGHDKNKYLGSEYDLGLAYAYTEDVTVGATVGVFNPGNAFTSANNKMASQALVNLDVKF